VEEGFERARLELRRAIGFLEPLGSLEGGKAWRCETGTMLAREKNSVVGVVSDKVCLELAFFLSLLRWGVRGVVGVPVVL